MTSKSSFEALEEILPSQAHEEMTSQAQENSVVNVEHDMLNSQACQVVSLLDMQTK